MAAYFTVKRVATMANVGQINRLQVSRHVDFGLYLSDGDADEILLPRREIPKNAETEPGCWLDVFVYYDSEDRIIATGRKPKVMLGQFASLRVVDINRTGIFLDWGLSKDLLMPHSEEKSPMQVGDSVVVFVYQDVHTGRLVASAQLERFVPRTAEDAGYEVNTEVQLLVAERTDLGFVCLVDRQYLGLLHHYEVFQPVRIGQRFQGYIREVREDGRLSVSLQLQGQEVRDHLSEQILAALEENGGRLELSDKSSAQAIADKFSVSKGNYKKALGQLYKQGLIEIYPTSIERTSTPQ